MTSITRFGIAFFLIVTSLSFVRASSPSSPSSCTNNEFWYSEKSCCLPHGGQPSPPAPPPDKSCPPSGWSWSKESSCCVPHHPTSPSSPPPQCSNGWDWFPSTYCCQQLPSHPAPPPPKPSGGAGKYGGWPRTLKSRAVVPTCPMGLDACPIPGAHGLTGDFECLDTTNELESCGGCASIGEGQDCTLIEGAWNVACEQGICAVYNCSGGYKHSAGGKSCVRI